MTTTSWITSGIMSIVFLKCFCPQNNIQTSIYKIYIVEKLSATTTKNKMSNFLQKFTKNQEKLWFKKKCYHFFVAPQSMSSPCCFLQKNFWWQFLKKIVAKKCKIYPPPIYLFLNWKEKKLYSYEHLMFSFKFVQMNSKCFWPIFLNETIFMHLVYLDEYFHHG